MMIANFLNPLFQILIQVPLGMWVISAYLIFTGLKFIRNRPVKLSTLLIMSVILIAINLLELNFKNSLMVVYFITALLAGSISGYYFTQNTHIRVLKNIKSIEISGLYQILVLLGMLLCIKCFFGFCSLKIFIQQFNILTYIQVLAVYVRIFFSNYISLSSKIFKIFLKSVQTFSRSPGQAKGWHLRV